MPKSDEDDSVEYLFLRDPLQAQENYDSLENMDPSKQNYRQKMQGPYSQGYPDIFKCAIDFVSCRQSEEVAEVFQGDDADLSWIEELAGKPSSHVDEVCS